MTYTDVLIFNVGQGQSIFIYPQDQPEYSMLVDCGSTASFRPIDFLVRNKYISDTLHNLTLTNYDQDHFADIENLYSEFKIRTVHFAPNLNSQELKALKVQPHSAELHRICDIKDRYVRPAQNYKPPYLKVTFYLDKHHLEGHDTNNLSQVVFIKQHGTVICITGDLEEKGWKALLEHKPDLALWLKLTDIFIASHHGRDNGYHSEIFSYCKPECIIISDKQIVHGTQENMSFLYGTHIKEDGIIFNGDTRSRRKVLTTRADGHIHILLEEGGNRTYKSFQHD